MFCKKCGKDNPDYAAFCCGCGDLLNNPETDTTNTANQKGGDKLATASLVMGLLSLFACGMPITTLLAIIFGGVAKSKGTIKTGRATFGTILGILGFTFMVIAVVFALIFFKIVPFPFFR